MPSVLRPGYYDRDNAFYLAWDVIARDPATPRGPGCGVGPRALLPRGVRGEVGRGALDVAQARARSLRRGRLRDVRVNDYTKNELMIAASARLLAGVENCFVGVGLPNIVCNLAQPDRGSRAPARLRVRRVRRPASAAPLSIGDPTLATGSTAITSMFELFAFYLQAGLIDVAFLGGAQIDRFGNLNTTVIGDYERPKVRLPSSGRACGSRSTRGRSS